MSAVRCIALVAVLAALACADHTSTATSAMYSLSGLPGQISWPFNVKWRMIGNTMAAGGDLVAIRMYWKAGQYAAVGFSPVSMQGYITACNVPVMDPSSAVCTDVIGYNGGGISKNPTQYSRLLWAKVQDAGFVEAEIEVPLSAVNISYAADGSTRLIFATSTWNSTNNMPEPHNGQNRMPVHVNLAAGTIAAKSLPMATAASHILQATPDFTAWWFVVYNTTMETSYSVFNIAISNAKRYAAIGVADAEGSKTGGFACYFDTTAECVDIIGDSTAPTTFTKILSSSKSGGMAYIAVQVKTPSPSATPERKTIFASGKWNSATNYPHTPEHESIKYIDFGGDELLAGNWITPFVLFPRYYAAWSIAQTQSGFSRYSMRAYLEVQGDYFVGIGFANKSMGGPLVACHMPQADALQVVCRDFIGQDEGGVKVNPEQSTKVVASWAIEGGLTAYIVDIDLAKFNVSATEAMTNFQRMIFAYGTWDAAKDKPTYHGPNATFFQVNIFTGATNGSAPPTAAPGTTAAPSMMPTTMAPMTTVAPGTTWALKQKTCTGNDCKTGCTTNTLPTGTCLGLNGGSGSAIATCHPNQGTVTLQIFDTAHCTGMSQSQSMPLDQCGNDGNGSVEDQCVPASGDALTQGAAFRPLKGKHSLKKF